MTLKAAEESTYCAFEVKVSNPSGAPFAKVPVGLVQGGTQFATVFTDVKGLARICDAPLHRVDIIVGGDLCGLVLVKNVKPTWPTTRQIFVTYVEDVCPHFTFPDNCQALLYVEDEKRQPLSEARFDGQPSGQPLAMCSVGSFVHWAEARNWKEPLRKKDMNQRVSRRGALPKAKTP